MGAREKFNSILDKYGYPVLVVRSDRKIRCSCWNEKTQEADRTCPACFGLGWNPKVEKHQARAQDTASAMSSIGGQAKAITQTPIGEIVGLPRQWFMRTDIKLQRKDLIVDVEWDASGKPVYAGGGIYEVNHIDETMKFANGEQVYKLVFTMDTPVQKNIRGIRIVEVQGIVNYELAMEDA